jgi:hypothetical protein
MSRVIFGGAVGLLAASVTFVGMAAGAVDDDPTEDNGGSIVEDFGYPGAEEILEQQGAELISGDGHIMLADCQTPPVGDIGLMKVYTTELIGEDHNGVVCFKVLGPVGVLHLRLPAVIEVRGDGVRSGTGHKGTATVTSDDGVTVTKALNPSGSIQFGIGEPGGTVPATLLKLTVAP